MRFVISGDGPCSIGLEVLRLTGRRFAEAAMRVRIHAPPPNIRMAKPATAGRAYERPSLPIGGAVVLVLVLLLLPPPVVLLVLPPVVAVWLMVRKGLGIPLNGFPLPTSVLLPMAREGGRFSV
jgi:hypothetical protein